MKKRIPNIEALNIIEESIKEGSPVRIRVRGNSMSPLLLDGIDVVSLRPFVRGELKIGDIILFRYREGFMLHRIIEIIGGKVGGTKIVTKGDAMEKCEEIEYSDVVALADVPKIGQIKKIVRKGRMLAQSIKKLYLYYQPKI